MKLLTSSQPKEQIVQGWATADMSDLSQVFLIVHILSVWQAISTFGQERDGTHQVFK